MFKMKKLQPNKEGKTETSQRMFDCVGLLSSAFLFTHLKVKHNERIFREISR